MSVLSQFSGGAGGWSCREIEIVDLLFLSGSAQNAVCCLFVINQWVILLNSLSLSPKTTMRGPLSTNWQQMRSAIDEGGSLVSSTL